LVIGIIYSRIEENEQIPIQMEDLGDVYQIEPPINNLQFFIQPKWAIASTSVGSGTTGHIGSTKVIADLVNGNGSFETEEEFDAFWLNR
jgi:hypothetical protein